MKSKNNGCYIKNALKLLDELFGNESNKIDKCVKDPSYKYESKLFELTLNGCKIGDTQNPKPKDGPGIYIFMIDYDNKNNQFVSLTDEFNKVKYGAKAKKAFVNKKIENGTILYLGKDEENILKRINEHLDRCSDKTYSLRIFDEKRKDLSDKIIIYAFVLSDGFQKYKKTILSDIENRLHLLLNPIVGSRRS